MGAFRHPLTVLSADPGASARSETVEALVDTGATFTLLPRDFLERLGWRADRFGAFEYADGRQVRLPMGEVLLRLNGERATSLCIFREPGVAPLLGVFTLEAFLLGIDPVNQRLVPVPGLLK